jgi:type IV pilus assembly protein PilW
MKSAQGKLSSGLCRRYQRGLSMIELMVALTIGSFLIAGTVFVYVQSRNSYGVNETVARLQETGRFALSIIEPDVRMSSYWGLMNDPELITGRAAQDEAISAVASSATAIECGDNFAVDAYTTVEGSDNDYTFGIGRDAGCSPGPNGVAQANADTLTIRRVSQTPAVAVAGRLQVCTTRTTGEFFSNGASPCPVAPTGRINDVVVNTYYVSADSDDRAGLPSLRRQALVAGLDFQDQEIVPGIEDLQVQLGIDPTGLSGTATQYINPDDAVPVGSQVVAVRVWILVRAENPEVGFTDGRVYNYGNRVNYQPNDGFRRVLFTRTIQVRNSLG